MRLITFFSSLLEAQCLQAPALLRNLPATKLSSVWKCQTRPADIDLIGRLLDRNGDHILETSLHMRQDWGRAAQPLSCGSSPSTSTIDSGYQSSEGSPLYGGSPAARYKYKRQPLSIDVYRRRARINRKLALEGYGICEPEHGTPVHDGKDTYADEATHFEDTRCHHTASSSAQPPSSPSVHFESSEIEWQRVVWDDGSIYYLSHVNGGTFSVARDGDDHVYGPFNTPLEDPIYVNECF